MLTKNNEDDEVSENGEMASDDSESDEYWLPEYEKLIAKSANTALII